MISSKTLKTKRAKVFVFKGSMETGSWGDSTPEFEKNNFRRWSGGWGSQEKGQGKQTESSGLFAKGKQEVGE